MVKKAIKPLEAEMKHLKTKLSKLVEGQNFISDKHNKMTNDHESVMTKSTKQNEEIKKLIKPTDEFA